MSGSKRNSTYSKTIPAESASIASVTPMKVTKEPAGPQPGTPEFVQAQMAERGDILLLFLIRALLKRFYSWIPSGITANPLQLMSEVGQKRPLGSDAGNAVTLIVVTVFDNSGENNHLPVAIFFKGDVFCVKDNIKQCDTAETIVNGLTIPVVMNALKAKYISGRLMKSLHAMAPPKCAYFAKYIREQCDVSSEIVSFFQHRVHVSSLTGDFHVLSSNAGWCLPFHPKTTSRCCIWLPWWTLAWT